MNKLKYVAAGVRPDFEKLLNKFVATEDINFQQFSKLWREMRFSFIFMGRVHKRELIEFTEECFCIAMSYWDNKHSFELQVGSFFLLYGLYIKQPGTTREKIRIKNEDWRSLKELVKKCEEKSMYDVVYLFYLLCEKNAFHYVFRANLFGPRTSMIFSDVVDSEKRWDNVIHETKSLLMKRELPHIAALHDQYQEAKKDLDPSMFKTLSLVKENVANKAMANIKKFLANKKVVTSDNAEDSEDECSDEVDSESPVIDSDVGARRAVLKDKMFKSRPTTTRSRRHRMVVSDESDVSPRKKRIKTTPI